MSTRSTAGLVLLCLLMVWGGGVARADTAAVITSYDMNVTWGSLPPDSPCGGVCKYRYERFTFSGSTYSCASTSACSMSLSGNIDYAQECAPVLGCTGLDGSWKHIGASGTLVFGGQTLYVTFWGVDPILAAAPTWSTSCVTGLARTSGGAGQYMIEGTLASNEWINPHVSGRLVLTPYSSDAGAACGGFVL